ncbi:protein of unknown function [Brochothrix thermosphacta]|nr:hypothetical protein BTH160X_140063 [Brochothrix thermosphacta]SPN71088.1 protein of unknown function [Brochothrix thermosphacta]SPN75766.1 hypothetical protein BTEBP_30077 [Brochothrix thermosphacta]SPP26965.1 hypothetical protein BTTAP_110025 [Brochothrix thermosphacta]
MMRLKKNAAIVGTMSGGACTYKYEILNERGVTT